MIAIRAFSIVRTIIRLCEFTSGLRVFWRRSRQKTRRTESAARQSAFCVNISALPCFPRGVRWGYAPQTAPRRLVSLDSLHLIRGRVRFTRRGVCVYNEDLRKHRNNLCPRSVAPTPRRRPDTRRDLPGSNLWPGKSGCTAIISTRSNVQTRAARRQRRGVGLRARSGVAVGTADRARSGVSAGTACR